MRPTVLVFFVISLAFGCGGAQPAPDGEPGAGAAPEPRPAAEARPAPGPPPPRPEMAGTIGRAELAAVLDGGLGRFLSGVGTEPQMRDGEFVGFRLTSLYPDDERMQAVDLGPGDVVTRVNGQPIERPEQALRVWNGLRVASELLIEYRREGEERELRFEIVDQEAEEPRE